MINTLENAMMTAPVAVASVEGIGHQGDVNFARVHDLPTGGAAFADDERYVVAEGRHGRHVLVGRIAVTGGGIAVDNAVLYHTDEPKARHAPVRFGSGVWVFWPHAELSNNEIIEQRD